MSILLSGDFHANERSEIEYISKKRLEKDYIQEQIDSIKYHIMLGDLGIGKPDKNKRDKDNYKNLTYRPFPILCVMGDDDPLLEMGKYTEEDIGLGESVLKISERTSDTPYIAYLKRGKVYHIEGIKFLVLGGALTIDNKTRKMSEKNHDKAFWSTKEREDLFKLLENENQFDFVISHTGTKYNNSYLHRKYSLNDEYDYDLTNVFNDEVDKKIQYIEWFCGHLHFDAYLHDYKNDLGYEYLYRRTIILDKIGDTIEQHYKDRITTKLKIERYNCTESESYDYLKHQEQAPVSKEEVKKYKNRSKGI